MTTRIETIDFNQVMPDWLAHSFPGVPDSAVGDTRTVRGVSVATFNATGKITQQRDYWNAPDLIG